MTERKKKQKTSGDDLFFTKEVNISLPCYLNPETWKKYMYSYKDVISTLKLFKSYHLQILCLILNCSVSNVIKVSYNSDLAMSYSSKAIITKKLENFLSTKKFPEKSVLDTILTNHVPPLPVIECSKETYDNAFKLLQGTIDYFEKNPAKGYLTFFINEFFLPIKTEAQYILMRRIYKIEDYLAFRSVGNTLVTKPIIFVIGNQEYYASEECFFLSVKK
jgi:hypothetical protein